ncbi:hypothetical protein JZ751_006281, partial [Albula glossodonta]
MAAFFTGRARGGGEREEERKRKVAGMGERGMVQSRGCWELKGDRAGVPEPRLQSSSVPSSEFRFQSWFHLH